MTDKQANTAALGIGLSLAAFIGISLFSNNNSIEDIMDTPVTPQATGTTPGATGITIGNVPTAHAINNPLDLIATNIPWQGKTTQPGASFESFEYIWQGYRAGIKTLWAHFKDNGQHTLNLIFAGDPSQGKNADGSMVSPGYAPAGQGGNSPQVYAQNVANATGITPDTDLTSYIYNAAWLNAAVNWMAKQEQGNTFVVNQNDINMALTSLGIS